MNLMEDKILITGGTGLIGINLTNRLLSMGCDVVSCGNTRGAFQYNLIDAKETRRMFDKHRPDVVIHLAARVGGIHANNNHKAQFYLENTLINTHVIKEVQDRMIQRYVFAMGTGCAYPKRLEKEVLLEEDFLDGKPEVTNDAYAYAKRNMLVHLKACRELFGLKYCYGIPANIYGPFDNFHPTLSHVVPALVRKFVEAKRDDIPKVSIWGTGSAKRDFLFIEDLIDAMILIMNEQYEGSINIATGKLTSIKDLAEFLQDITGYHGEIVYDTQFPDGQLERIFNTDKIRMMGWKPEYSLAEGLVKTIRWFEQNGKD
jgi:GDP-L-fucose synthase